MISDQEIISAFQRGDNQGALNALYKSALPKIVGYVCKNSGTDEDGKDMFQDAVVILFKQISTNSLEIKQSVEAYVFTIARNLWINKAKRDSKQIYTDEVPEPNEQTQSHVGLLISQERESRVKEVFSQLGDKCAELLNYVFYYDYSLADITEKMGFSSSEVAHTTNYRCKKKLIALVGDDKKFLTLLKTDA